MKLSVVLFLNDRKKVGSLLHFFYKIIYKIMSTFSVGYKPQNPSFQSATEIPSIARKRTKQAPYQVIRLSKGWIMFSSYKTTTLGARVTSTQLLILVMFYLDLACQKTPLVLRVPKDSFNWLLSVSGPLDSFALPLSSLSSSKIICVICVKFWTSLFSSSILTVFFSVSATKQDMDHFEQKISTKAQINYS